MSDTPPKQGKDIVLPRETKGKAGFGVDQPGALIQLVAAGMIMIVTGFVVASTVFRSDAALGTVFLVGMPVAGAMILAVTASIYWSNRLGKPREIVNVMKEIPWGGSEVAVDVGCGRGLMMIDAAKRFDHGIAVGADVWRPRDVSGNDPTSVWANARVAHVLDNVALVKSDARSLPFANDSVDVGMSSMTIHLLGGRSIQQAAIKELVRIVKRGGRVAIIDAGRGGEYADYLKEEGMVDLRISRIRFRSFPPLHSVTARKPYLE